MLHNPELDGLSPHVSLFRKQDLLWDFMPLFQMCFTHRAVFPVIFTGTAQSSNGANLHPTTLRRSDSQSTYPIIAVPLDYNFTSTSEDGQELIHYGIDAMDITVCTVPSGLWLPEFREVSYIPHHGILLYIHGRKQTGAKRARKHNH